ncbi:putative carbohydrate kinase [Escherichia coli]|uniref:Putative carbohydrate kinase n=1 Tax=Escherichia coli TaxID=562 RepID=A0A377E3T2_ECOLX|nr:putative carbohydrate kinase [Escherichia coli]
MREGIVLYNNEGTPIWACANVDARAAREVSELKELHNNTFENEVYRATGPNTGFKCHPQITLAGAPSFRYLPSGINHHHDQRLAAYMLSGELAWIPLMLAPRTS